MAHQKFLIVEIESFWNTTDLMLLERDEYALCPHQSQILFETDSFPIARNKYNELKSIRNQK